MNRLPTVADLTEVFTEDAADAPHGDDFLRRHDIVTT
jgi:hypothetical protein